MKPLCKPDHRERCPERNNTEVTVRIECQEPTGDHSRPSLVNDAPLPWMPDSTSSTCLLANYSSSRRSRESLFSVDRDSSAMMLVSALTVQAWASSLREILK